MTDHYFDLLWSDYTTWPNPLLGRQTLHRTCTTFTKHVLHPSDIILAGGGYVLHPNLAGPLSEAIPTMTQMIRVATKHCGLRVPATQNQIVWNWITLIEELYVAMANLRSFRHGVSGSGAHERPSRMPYILSSLPPALRAKLPKEFLHLYGFSTSPASLFDRVASIASKKSLHLSDIVDRSADFDSHSPLGRFGLEPDFLLTIKNTINEMQVNPPERSPPAASRTMGENPIASESVLTAERMLTVAEPGGPSEKLPRIAKSSAKDPNVKLLTVEGIPRVSETVVAPVFPPGLNCGGNMALQADQTRRECLQTEALARARFAVELATFPASPKSPASVAAISNAVGLRGPHERVGEGEGIARSSSDALQPRACPEAVIAEKAVGPAHPRMENTGVKLGGLEDTVKDQQSRRVYIAEQRTSEKPARVVASSTAAPVLVDGSSVEAGGLERHSGKLAKSNVSDDFVALTSQNALANEAASPSREPTDGCTSRCIVRVSGICSKARPRDHAPKLADLPPSPKSPTPALTNATAVELGGLPELVLECPAEIEDQKSGCAFIPEQRTSQEHVGAGVTIRLSMPAHASLLLASSPTIPVAAIQAVKTFALVSAIVWTRSATYLARVQRGELASCRAWAREGIGTHSWSS
ncbi:hypothetical protein B0H13DRAFT_1859547 [Mycena leptocephala]|nr:hypothetical protein B0H13DRAFT_1859547 [Mycena leptocephala]